MPGSTGNQGPGSQLSLGAIIALLVAGVTAIVVTTLTISGSAVFNAAAAPSGEAAKTKIWHDSTTAKLMSNVANGGAKYVVDTGGFTANYIPKASAVGTLGDGRIIDTGSQIQIPIAPVTADADADVTIQSTAATQVPLVVKGAASQSDTLTEWQDSTGNAQAYITSDGYGIVKGLYTGTSGCAIDYGTAGGLESMVTGGVFWSATTDPTAAKDTGITRKTAGEIEINGGTAATTAGKLSVCATASSYLTTQTITELVTIGDGATKESTANLIPANAYIIGVTARVTEVLSESRTFKLGVTGTDDKFAEALQPGTAGQMTSTWSTGHAAGTGGPASMLAPYVNPTAATVLITPSAADATDPTGKIRITVFYQSLTPPGS